ncbi:PH domain-containing protein, partial [Lactococcus lactis]
PYIEQLKKAGVSDTFGTKKEVKQLPQVMRENEIISFATSGFVDGDTVLIVITNFRLFFLNNGMIFGKKFTEFPLDKITDLTYSQKLLLA